MNIVEYCLHTVGVVENPVDNVKNSLYFQGFPGLAVRF